MSNTSEHNEDIPQINNHYVHKDESNKKCFFCEVEQQQKYYIFDKHKYDNNLVLEQIIHNESNISQNSIICYKCHKSIITECFVKCVMCRGKMQRKHM